MNEVVLKGQALFFDLFSVANDPVIRKLAPENGFGIGEHSWQKALVGAKPDSLARIRHARLHGDESWRLHVAEISDRIACHVHKTGIEVYEIVAGTGTLYSGPTDLINGSLDLLSHDKLLVKKGDVFIVPEGYAHQLVRSGSHPLIIIFACPDSHLADDRFLLPDFFEEQEKTFADSNTLPEKNVISSDVPRKNAGVEKNKLSEIINISDLQRLQDSFANAHGVGSLITDSEGKSITQPSNFTRLCASIVRKTKKGRINCSHSTSIISCCNLAGPIIQTCPASGLWVAGVSIVVGGEHVASWLIGQVRNEQINEQKMMEYAEEIGVNKADFKATLQQVPAMSEEQFKKNADLLFVFASVLSEKAFSNLELKKQIDENEKINARLVEHKENLAITLHSIGDGVISTDKDGLIVNMNRIAENLCGWNLSDAIGKRLTEVFNLINSRTEERVPDPVTQVLETGKIIELSNHTVLISKNGAQYQISDSAAPIKNIEGRITGVVLVFSDVTEKYIAQKLINDNEFRLRGLFENLEAGIVVHAQDTSIIVNNSRACELLGLTDEQLRGKKAVDPAWNFLNENGSPLSFEHFPVNRILKTKRPIKNQILGIQQSGKNDKNITWVTVNGFPAFDDKGDITEIVTSFIDVTEQKNAETQLVQSECKLKEAQRIAHLGTWEFKVETSELFWSDEIYRILDCEPDTFKPTYQIFLEFIHPDDREMVNFAYKNSLKTKKDYQIEHRILTKKGQTKFIKEKCSTTFNEEGKPLISLGIFLDITEQKQSEIELAESLERFKALHNASFGGISIHDKGIIIECNQGLSDMSGYSLKELVGMDGLLLIAPNYREMVMSNILAGYEKPYEAEGLRKNGEIFPIRLEARNVPYKGKKVRTVEFRDITESRKLEQVVIRQERLSAIGELASGVAHDFNNALQIILGGAELALKITEPGKTEQCLRSIKNSAKDAASRVRQLQRFAQKNQSVRETSAININTLAEDVIKESRFLLSQYQEKGVHITVKPDYKAEKNIDGNVGQLRVCLFNLIKNSAESMPNGGKITVSTDEYDGKVYVGVADTGTGMDEETQKKIFQPFYTTKGYEPGRGLGMSQVYSTIKEHNGEIYIKESKIGLGTSIEIALPCSDKQITLEEKERNYVGSTRILWVDDEEMIRFMGKNMLEILGHTADFAASGAEALEFFAKGNEYDLVITDIGMPEMSGWQLAEQIKIRKIQALIAVVTGWGDEVSKEMKDKYNIAYVLGKPLPLKDLQALISAVLQLKKDPHS